jgi:hypothetical protein
MEVVTKKMGWVGKAYSRVTPAPPPRVKSPEFSPSGMLSSGVTRTAKGAAAALGGGPALVSAADRATAAEKRRDSTMHLFITTSSMEQDSIL